MFRLALLIVLLTASRAYADTYEVKAGDTCISIVTKQLGGRGQLAAFHAANPALGPQPHRLKPGMQLTLPARADAADAILAEAQGTVNVRQPSTEAWRLARRGMDLFRAWRVGTEAQARAAIDFVDSTKLTLREHTIVIIYGAPSHAKTPRASTAFLESGALRSRLSELAGARVLTPSAELTGREGVALLTVDAQGTSTIANHGAPAMKVRGLDAKQRPKRRVVALATGMGTKVARGSDPTPPRALPAPPQLTTPEVSLVTSQGTSPPRVTLAWQAHPLAREYRVELWQRDAQGLATNLHTSAIVPAAQTSHTVEAPAGGYLMVLAVMDLEGFESAPTQTRLDVLAVEQTADRVRVHGPAAHRCHLDTHAADGATWQLAPGAHELVCGPARLTLQGPAPVAAPAPRPVEPPVVVEAPPPPTWRLRATLQLGAQWPHAQAAALRGHPLMALRLERPRPGAAVTPALRLGAGNARYREADLGAKQIIVWHGELNAGYRLGQRVALVPNAGVGLRYAATAPVTAGYGALGLASLWQLRPDAGLRLEGRVLGDFDGTVRWETSVGLFADFGPGTR